MTQHTPNAIRRRLLKANLAAASLFLPVPYAWVWAQSQSDGAMKLVRLPKLALIIGNSNYKAAPTLINPGNDAKAIGDTLRQSGFEVTVKLDAARDDMAAAIRAHVQTLAARKAVGLFYFAGHGLQLAWRNYLVPVDAAVRKLEDIQTACVDLTSLIDGINKASNPMNVVILDACRENPFGDVRVESRGLSQIDAPHSTLLAYATAPGNVASDGEGANGLYTENLLREIKAQDAKIEDIFKRVRLHVRRRTNGQQIPWESTSLEEDFYFLPPKALSSAAEEAAERERQQEIAAREKRRAAAEAERKHQQEIAAREAKLAAEAAERKRQQEIAELEKQRLADEAARRRKQELALQEAQRVAEETERKRREAQALQEAKAADEEAQRKHQQALALREQQRMDEDAARQRKEEQTLREAKLAAEEAERKYQQEQAAREQQRAQAEAERKRAQQPVVNKGPDLALTERQFEEELAIWERIETATERAPLEDYLLRYPSGRFSELAQLRLDEVLVRQGEKRIEVVSDARNPYSRGSARANTRYKVGDSYIYRRIDRFTGSELQTFTSTIVEITDTEVIYNGGLVTNLLGNRLRSPDGRRFTPGQEAPLEFAVGKRWTTRFNVWRGEDEAAGERRGKGGGGGRLGRPRGGGNSGGVATAEIDFRIVARERVTVPAGTFDTFRLEGRGWSTGLGPAPVRIETNIWRAPGELRRPVIVETHRQAGPKVIESNRDELMAFKQS